MGVRGIYGYPGDDINGITAAWRKGGHDLDLLQVRRAESSRPRRS
jgi:hypothetical protein